MVVTHLCERHRNKWVIFFQKEKTSFHNTVFHALVNVGQLEEEETLYLRVYVPDFGTSVDFTKSKPDEITFVFVIHLAL